MLCNNISSVGSQLFFAGVDTAELASRFGTPLFLMDEEKIRSNIRTFREALASCYGSRALMLYASKACSFRRMLEIVGEEGAGIDVVSPGEICTAVSAGFDMSRAFFHGNNKSVADIAYAMEQGVGFFVTDNAEELSAIDAIAAAHGIRQNILLRITPGIDCHSYEAVNTGKVDSKFGSPIETGQAEAITALALSKKNISLRGFHCHVGSQVFFEDVFERTAAVMMHFLADIKARLGYEAEYLDLGGGFGVRYRPSDPCPDPAEKIRNVSEVLHSLSESLGIALPYVLIEPGRAIVADAGMTLYTAGAVKRIPEYKNYVSVDGGMGDNPRYALYGSEYTCLNASRMEEACDMVCDLVGRYCESGDIIQPSVSLPSSTARGDIIAVCTTGAYNYSMAMPYNRVPAPPVVLLNNGQPKLAVRRQTVEDLCRCDL